MSMVRCSANKHFYDTNVHQNCPYCTVAYDGNLGNFGAGGTELSADTMGVFQDKTEVVDSYGLRTESPTQEQFHTVRVYENGPTEILDQNFVQGAFPMSNETPAPTPARREPIKTKVFGFNNSESQHTNEQVAVQISPNTDLSKLPVTGWLVIIDGPGVGLDFRLIQGENRIGRDKEMEICLDFGDISDDMVSRDSHAIVVYDNHANVFFVERGRSRNMPLLNDRTIRSGEDLKAGDIIQVGKTKLMLVSFCNESFKWG